MYTLEISELQRRALVRALILTSKHDQESGKRRELEVTEALLENIRNLKETK